MEFISKLQSLDLSQDTFPIRGIVNSMKQFGAKCRPERVVHGGGEIQKIMCGKGERRDVILKWGDRGRWRDTKGSQKCLK
jgi:hypothetical protein